MSGSTTRRRRLLTLLELRFRKARPGSVLIFVVALLVLLALLGTAYISSARGDRFSAQQNQFNTEVDLLLKAVVQMEQDKIANAGNGPTADAAGSAYHHWNSPSDENWWGSRVPVLMANNQPGWRYIAVSPIGVPFESPMTGANPGQVVTYTTRQNLVSTYVQVQVGDQMVRYPGFLDTSSGQTFLAASASGDGIADAGLWRIPIGELNGVTYYAAVRVLDNNSAVDASVADARNMTTTMPGDYFPSNVDLSGLLIGGSTELSALDTYRCNGAASMTPVDDNGNIITSFNFVSVYDAMWHQLGRRLDLPGFNTRTAKYQALTAADSTTLAHRFCLANASTSPSVVEQALTQSLLSGNPAAPVPSNAYAPDQVTQWYKQNFAYENEKPGTPSTYLPRRVLLTGRSPVNNFAPQRANAKGNWAAGLYSFGDEVTYNDHAFFCIQDQSDAPPEGDPINSASQWVRLPWNDYPVRTSINTAAFGQLWSAYWNVMAESQGSVPAGTDTRMFRNPIRSAVNAGAAPAAGSAPAAAAAGVTVAPTGGDDTATIQAAIDSSAPGAIISFAGNYRVSSKLNFLPDRTYTGGPGGGGIVGLSPYETLLLRSALSAVNSEQLRASTLSGHTANDVISRSISLGGTITKKPTTTGGTTFTWAGGTNNFMVEIDGHGATVTGITFQGAGMLISSGDTVDVEGCTFQNIGDNAVYVAGIRNSKLAFNHLSQVGGTGFTIYSPNASQFDDNTFDNCFEGIHAFFYSHGAGLSVSRNVVTHTTRHAIELQSSPQGLTVDGNWIDFFLPHLDPVNHNDSHMGISCATGIDKGMDSHNVRVTNNYIGGNGINTANNPGGGYWDFAAIEIMGASPVVSGNYIYNWGFGVMDGQMNASPNSGWTCTNNIFVQVNVPITPEAGGTPPANSSGNRYYASLSSPGCPPPPPQPNGTFVSPVPATPLARKTLSYVVSVFGTSQQPYITEVYANDDPSTANGYIAVELYNPYNYDITMNNWRLATVSRPSSGVSAIIPRPLASTVGWDATPPTVPAHGFLVLVSSDTPPASVSKPPTASSNSIVLTLPDLVSAFDQELILLRPRRADGQLQVHLDDPVALGKYNASNPTVPGVYDVANVYDEVHNLADWAPIDSYDFTGLYPKDNATVSAEWHYVRPNDATAQKAWHFVYPGKYIGSATGSAGQNTTVGNQPRLASTDVISPARQSNIDLSTLGQPDSGGGDPAATTPGNHVDFPLQVNNTDFGGAKVANFPHGGFARDGDILQVTYVGSYSIKMASSQQYVELNPVTMDSAFADDTDPGDDSAENIGRFCPIHPGDLKPPMAANDPNAAFNDYSSDSTRWTSYHFAMRLFDFLSVQAPHDDYLPNMDPNMPNTDPTQPNDISNPMVLPVANADAHVVNSTVVNDPQGKYPKTTTEDNIPLEGLININTAPWRVLSALPMSDDAAVNAQLAQAIVYYRDVDDGSGNPHGPFKSIWELNGVIGSKGTVAFRNTLGAFKTNYDPATATPTNVAGYLTPSTLTTPSGQNQAGFVYDDFETQNLALTRISNLITTRSDSFTVYVVVQGFRNAGTANPELVVQRRAAFIADRSHVIPTNKMLNIINVPAD